MRKGTFGYRLTLHTGLDLSSATDVRVRILRPPGVNPVVIDTVLQSADITQPSSGTIGYPVSNGDFPVDGMYSIQVFDETPGRNISSEIVQFYVNDNLPTP